MYLQYLTVILWGRAGYELMYITNEAVGRVGYYQLISGKSEKNNCFSKFSHNSLDFFGWNLLKSWHFLFRRCSEKIFSDLQNFSTRNSPSVFSYLVKLNDNGSYHGLREPIRKLENHNPELKIYKIHYIVILVFWCFICWQTVPCLCRRYSTSWVSCWGHANAGKLDSALILFFVFFLFVCLISALWLDHLFETS